ncbi:unnamed protein product [Amoebophrya sp. A120]|nr:unnamed protein product [Amoebophrya sp. A120]|eukprot:GSA120T00011010001.1
MASSASTAAALPPTTSDQNEGAPPAAAPDSSSAVGGAGTTEDKPKAKVVEVEIATTNRSRCKSCECLQVIEKGTVRVGVPMFMQGRTLTAWFHPHCFFDGLSVEVVQRNGAGMCKHTRKKFEKGDFRAKVCCGNAKFGLSLQAARELFQPVLESLTENKKRFRDIAGVETLPADLQAQFLGSDDGILASKKKITSAADAEQIKGGKTKPAAKTKKAAKPPKQAAGGKKINAPFGEGSKSKK